MKNEVKPILFFVDLLNSLRVEGVNATIEATSDTVIKLEATKGGETVYNTYNVNELKNKTMPFDVLAAMACIAICKEFNGGGV